MATEQSLHRLGGDIDSRIAGLARNHPDWNVSNDARLTGLGKLFNVVASSELGLGFAGNCLLSDAWWLEIAGSLPKDKHHTAQQFRTFVTVGFVQSIQAAVESSFRVFLGALDPNACSGATTSWDSVYRCLLGRVDLCSAENIALLDLLRHLRNTVHNNGVYFDQKHESRSVEYRGRRFDFNLGQKVMPDSELLLQIAQAVTELLYAVVRSNPISDHEGAMLDPSM